MVRRALIDSVVKLSPRHMKSNPVMFVVEIGSVLTTFYLIRDFGSSSSSENVFALSIVVWLWFTVLFANFAEAVAEGRGKAQAETLRKTRAETVAFVQRGDDVVEVPSSQLQLGDLCVVTPGQLIPGDGDIVEGIATVDESAITGESAPVIRESGGDRSSVTGGTRVLSDRIVVKITSKPGETFLDRMIALVEGASRQKTPNEIALDILLAGLTIVFMFTVVSLQPFSIYSGAQQSIIVLVALLVCLIPTTIGALLSAIGIAGMDRLVQRNVLAMSGRAVEAAGDVSTLLLDKTGTITFGNRRADVFVPMPDVEQHELAAAAHAVQPGRRDPRGPVHRGAGRVPLRPGGPRCRRRRAGALHRPDPHERPRRATGGRSARARPTPSAGGSRSRAARPRPSWPRSWRPSPRAAARPLVVADGPRVLGVIHLKDVVKPGIAEKFVEMRTMGIRTVMITGDNPLTAAAIAAEAGVDDFLAEATPEDKMALIKKEQSGGHLVAMTGDGTNDAPALAQADVGVAMNSGTQAAKEAGNMVDLDSNPTKLIDIVEIGKQLLITRGSLTTFSITNDIAKFFAIIPAMFVGVFPALNRINIMHLSSPHSAILSAVIFNALIIVALIPLALRGVKFRAASAAAVLRRNLLIYGLGGFIIPFIGIKLIDLIITALGVK